MSEIRVPFKRKFMGTIFCKDCRKEVPRGNYKHIRCAECNDIAHRRNRGDRFEHRFPVVRDDMVWVCQWLIDTTLSESPMTTFNRDAEDKIQRNRRMAMILFGPTPCDGCGWAEKCSDGLACRSFWKWSESNKKKTDWDSITHPNKTYYKRCFPRDTAQNGRVQ
jgi:LSD1 subclass zinc finger protein